ncbi:MAG: LLM class flavin-dependent oxidoreductase, partial [Akkermansiaceae bacterium]|nr:LLM class flavin-dependent oxidoreductase [Armatimonadota bacterium]
AERLEFAGLYLADHFDALDPVATLTYAAGSTGHVSLGSLVAPVSFRDPVMLARQAPVSNLTRTSTDFWPNKPESHGLHLWVNAQVSAWFGHFVHPDWDMFQSGHTMGLYHAAGRAVSGSPVYVSDKPGTHDVEVLRKLVTPDGRVFRCDSPGVPTRDCLFADVTKEPVLLKISNVSRGGAQLLGVFNARYAETGTEPVTGAIALADLSEGFIGERLAVYAHNAKELRVLAEADRWEITLAQLECEVFTLVPLFDYGFAAIGLSNYFNAAGAVVEASISDDEKTHDLLLETGGNFLAYCEAAPQEVEIDGDAAPFDYDPATKALRVTVGGTGLSSVRVVMT